MYLISGYSSNANQLTQERKKQIRRNEQISQEQYHPPQIFKLMRVGKTRILEQGDVIVGKVKVVTTSKIACQLIYVEFKGNVTVDFNVPSTTMIDEIQNFHKEWDFFSHKIPVFMHEQRGYNFLEPGIYEFYFKCRVPIGGPCSFISDIADVSYKCSGVFVRNDVTNDIYSDNSLCYHVHGYKDLNLYDGARVGLWQDKIALVGGFCGMLKGKVEVRLKTDKRAYVPGEKIYIMGEFWNNTWRKCTLTYELIQDVKMWGEHYFWRSDSWGTRFLRDKLVMDRGEDCIIHSGDHAKFDGTLEIPFEIAPSYLGMTHKDYINDLITLEYNLRFEIAIPYATNMRFTLPIVIGTEQLIFLPDPPAVEKTLSQELTQNSNPKKKRTEEEKVNLEILDMQKTSPFIIPKFHPLNKKFQKRFPETFGKSSQSNKRNGKHRKCDCDCHHKSKKRHRSMCAKMVSQTMGPATSGKTRKVKTDYGQGIELEESTYSNWLASCIDDHLEDDGRQTNKLLTVMKEYGLIS